MTILFAWLLADFLTGLVHFAQDRLLLWESRFKFINQVKADNDLHHRRPGAMLQYSVWENINTSVPIAWPASAILFALGCPTVVWLAFFFAGFGNAVHRLSHAPKSKRNRLVKFLQWTGIFISFDHHHKHHFDAKGLVEKENTTVRYCPMTNWLNPILDGVRFFDFLAYLLVWRRT